MRWPMRADGKWWKRHNQGLGWAQAERLRQRAAYGRIRRSMTPPQFNKQGKLLNCPARSRALQEYIDTNRFVIQTDAHERELRTLSQ